MKRKHVLGIVVFFFIYIVASLGGEHETRSSFSFAPTGTKAVHDALLELDLPVVWWRKPFPLLAQELPKGSTLLVVTPSEPLEKIRELLDWVKSGNRLLVFGAGGAGLQSEPLDEFWMAMKVHPDRFRLSKMVDDLAQDVSSTPGEIGSSYWEDVWQKVWTLSGATRVESVEPDFAASGSTPSIKVAGKNVKRLQLGKAGLLESSPLDFEELLKSKKNVLTVSLPENSKLRPLVKREKSASILQREWGEGEIWMFADSAIVENEFVDQEDNFRLIYQLVAGAEAIAFDEYHHGYIEPAPEQVRGKRDALLVFIGALALSLALIALSRSVRFGPASPTPLEDVASSTEFATALGLLCKDYRARDLLAYYRQLWLKRVSRLAECQPESGERVVLERAVEKNIFNNETRKEAEKLLLEFEKRDSGSESQMLFTIEALEKLLTKTETELKS